MYTAHMIQRKPDTVLIPASCVVNSYGGVWQVWVGDGHERRAQRQADALNRAITRKVKVQPIWVERKASHA